MAKKAKKKVVKKAAKKKAKKKEKASPDDFKRHGLHEKKLLIMAKHPIMPCSILTNDRAGNMFAHTKASEIFGRYSEACREQRLVINMVECNMENVDFGSHKGSRARCKFMIKDIDTGEIDFFWGSGLGDNMVWSDQSAQTVAFKQGLIMYFFTSWPQPDEFISVAKDYMEKLPEVRQVEVIREMLPKMPMTDKEGVEAMEKFWKDMVG